MPRASSSANSLVLVWGEDEFAVKEKARQIFQEWTSASGSFDQEIIEASAASSHEAIRCLRQLRESIQTLPFFGGTKIIWFKNCNFLGEERTASAKAVTETLASLAAELKTLDFSNLRLLISAGKVDKRRVFYKTVEKIGAMEHFPGWSADSGQWTTAAELLLDQQLKTWGKRIVPEASAKLIAQVGPNSGQLASEIEKLALFTGERAAIELADVEAVSVRNKQSQAFALGDALGERNLPRLLKCLDEELWEMRGGSQNNEIRLLYGLISKVRALIFVKEMLQKGWIQKGGAYGQFKAQLGRVPPEAVPADKRFNPLAIHPYVLYNAIEQSERYTLPELIGAIELLLRCNEQLIFSRLDGALILQQTLIKIANGPVSTGIP
jgi:DNA polymerase III subunit delta